MATQQVIDEAVEFFCAALYVGWEYSDEAHRDECRSTIRRILDATAPLLGHLTDDGAGSSPANPPAADVPPPAPSSLPRLFVLDRHTDVTGQSGTGVVVEGVVWSDGTVSVRWLTEHRSFANWPSVDSLLAVHGHNGATELRWLDTEPDES